ncbi:hypothetical protein [Novipirellula sp.]|uniref:hypothetical protein n=1 Tax=Novipirellula sp. TaxID=2795430 RepID=UPI0035632190
MTSRLLLAVIFTAAAFTQAGYGADSSGSTKPIWVVVESLPDSTDGKPRYSVQVSSGVGFGLADAISEALTGSATENTFLRPVTDFDLSLSLESSLVMKIDKSHLTIAPGERFSFSKVAELAKRLEKIGLSEASIASIDTVLTPKPIMTDRKTIFSHPFEESFEFHVATTSPSDAAPIGR